MKRRQTYMVAMFAVSVLMLLTHSTSWMRSAARTSDVANAGATETAKALILENYSKLPLSFEANQGQVDRQVKFLSRGQGYNFYLTPNEAVMKLQSTDFPEAPNPAESPSEIRAPQSATLRMKLVGANRHPRLSGLDQLPGKSNYFFGRDVTQWKTDVPNFAKVKAESVYPGIDVIYYGNQQQLEYDFIVAPGSDPKTIELSFSGAQRMRLDEQGDLVLTTHAGEVRQHKPVVYQEANGVRQEVAGRYVINRKNQVSIEVGEYDRSQPLVIDPVIVYSTKLTRIITQVEAIAVDAAGYAYVTGVVLEPGFPVTPGAVNVGVINETNSAAYVTKFKPDGSGLVYSAIFGGSAGEVSRAISLDTAGNAYIAGYTPSNDFPTTPGALKPTNFTGLPQAFVLKLNTNGSQILYSTYLGGEAAINQFVRPLSGATAITVDATGNAYVVGNTGGVFPTTPDAFQPNYTPGNGGNINEAFVAKVSADGTRLLYSTLLGSGGGDGATGVALDPAGNIYVSGATTNGYSQRDMPLNAPFPVTPGAFKSPDAVQEGGIFVTKFNPAGGVIYSTIVGGGDGMKVAADAQGNAYLAGSARSADFPTTPGAFQTSGGSNNPASINDDGFISKLSADGSQLIYSTFLGGADGVDRIFGLAVDPQGHAYITGYTTSPDFPSTSGTVGSVNAFVTKLKIDGSGLVYSALLGPGRGYGVALDLAGNAYAAGEPTVSFPTTEGAYERAAGATTFVVKIAATTTPEPVRIVAPRQDPDSDKIFFIGGRIRDTNGQFVAGATVKIVGSNIRDSFRQNPFVVNKWTFEADGTISQTVMTSVIGGYSFTQAPAGGNYIVTPTKAGYSFVPLTQTVNNLGRDVSLSFQAESAALPLSNVSAASYGGTILAREMIVSAFGANLATETQAASSIPLPTVLGGTRLLVRDSLGHEREAPLFFVSPTQINYLMPTNTSAGPATITVISGGGAISRATAQLAATAPGLFTVDASGRGLAAAVVLRIKAGGTQVYEPVSRFDPAQGKVVAVPIDLGPEGDQVLLLTFGTGTRYRSGMSAVSAKLGGVNAPVLFTGAQDGFAGLDQSNVQIPRSLSGRGEIDVVLTVDGKAANTVKVWIK